MIGNVPALQRQVYDCYITSPWACRSTPDAQRHEHESLVHNLTPDGYCDVEIEYSGKKPPGFT